jgi:hypothetical protein
MPAKRKDSVTEQVKIAQSAIEKIVPPNHVSVPNAAKPFYDAIVRARLEWTEVDLAHAANLARCQADIEINEIMLKAEGAVITNAKGMPVMNPRHAILEQLSRRSVALSRMLQVHAIATVGPTEDQRGKNTAKRKAIESFSEEDDLIARPH